MGYVSSSRRMRRRHTRCTLRMLLLLATASAFAQLDEHIEQLKADKSACSACNLVARTFDSEPLTSKLVRGWKEWAAATRTKQLQKALRSSCTHLSEMEIGFAGTPGLSKAYF